MLASAELFLLLSLATQGQAGFPQPPADSPALGANQQEPSTDARDQGGDAAVAEADAANPSGTLQDAARPLRIAVYELDRASVPTHWGAVVTTALLAELRKLEKTSVIGMDEVRAMLGHEANKAAVGCDQESCLGEIADALGVDMLVIGSMARVGDQHVFSLRRLDQVAAKVTGGVNRRFEAGNGEEFLVAIGPAVAELFPDRPLRPGAERGVAKEMGLRLNPPPLPSWVFWSGASVTAACAVGVVTMLGVHGLAQWDLQTYKSTANPFSDDTFQQKALTVDLTAYATYLFAGTVVALVVATGVAAFFTDFFGYAELNEEASR